MSNTGFSIQTIPKEMSVKVIDQSNPLSNINLIEFVSQEEVGPIRKEIKENEIDNENKYMVESRRSKAKSGNLFDNFDESIKDP